MSEETKIETPKEKPFYHDKSSAGKGDRPRSISQRFRDNWDLIDWHKNEGKIVVRIEYDW